MRDADIQDVVYIRPLNMHGWIQKVWTVDINLGVSTGSVRWRWGNRQSERRGLRPEPRATPIFKHKTSGEGSGKEPEKELWGWGKYSFASEGRGVFRKGCEKDRKMRTDRKLLLFWQLVSGHNRPTLRHNSSPHIK